jgi:hypothetical protein
MRNEAGKRGKDETKGTEIKNNQTQGKVNNSKIKVKPRK